MIFSRHIKLQLFVFLILIFLTACSTKTEGQKKFGNDSDYFIGLKLLEEGNEKAAAVKFRQCLKKGTYLCAQNSARELCNLGTIQEKNQSCLDLIEKFPESENLLIAVKQLYSTGEINKVIELTSSVNLITGDNELIKVRLDALNKRQDSSLKNSIWIWFTSRTFSDYHYRFYKENQDLLKNELNISEVNIENLSPDQLQLFILNYRIETYKKNYSYTSLITPELIKGIENKFFEPFPQMASDMGKTMLYGSSDYYKNAVQFSALADLCSGTPVEYYFWFYAGRFYDKAGNYFTRTKQCFEKAMESTASPEQKDDALWYLLKTSFKFSEDILINSIGNYCKLWNNPEYFEDLFEDCVSSILIAGKWNAFGSIYKQIDGYASNETVAQYAYIYARLAQLGFAKATDEEIKAAFLRATKSGSALHYRVLATYELEKSGYKPELLLESITAGNQINQSEKTKKQENPADILINGYVYFGFPQLVYKNYMKYRKDVSCNTALMASEFLKKCGTEQNDYYTESLRIASRAYKKDPEEFTKDDFKLLYPQNYYNYIENSCNKYDLNPAILLALIRSESFFDADVSSYAGAIGLTQLMDFTASDIARRLKKSDYNLTDPETNIDFGAYYLADLIRRCDGSLLQAFFSYNAGINRVRKWLKSTTIGFGQKRNMPPDLFLEIVPYAETREYGRKLLSASVMYEWLYSDSPEVTKETLENIIY